MKVAVIIAKFPSGWRTIAVGGEIGEIKAAFKGLKGAGVLVHKGEAAELAMMFDSAGNMSRKFLRTPAELALRADGQASLAAEVEAKEIKLADAAAKAEGADKARAIAEKAVALVTSEIAAAGQIFPKAHAPAEEVAPVAPVPTDAEPVSREAEPDDTGNAAERFGGGKKAAAPKTLKR